MSDLRHLWLRYLDQGNLNREESAALKAALEVDQPFAQECRQDIRCHGAIKGLLIAETVNLYEITQESIAPQKTAPKRGPPQTWRNSLWVAIATGLLGGGLWLWTQTSDAPAKLPSDKPVSTQQMEPLLLSFGNPKYPPPEGYQRADTKPYNSQQGYGWTTDHPRRTRRRAHSDPLRRDILFAGGSWFTDQWEIEIPSGQYRITVTSGDSKDDQGPHYISAEGIPLLSGETTKPGEYIEGSAVVTVSDGRLTLDVGDTTPLKDHQDPEIEIHKTDSAILTLTIRQLPR